jgi:hypothetical protein
MVLGAASGNSLSKPLSALFIKMLNNLLQNLARPSLSDSSIYIAALFLDLETSHLSLVDDS